MTTLNLATLMVALSAKDQGFSSAMTGARRSSSQARQSLQQMSSASDIAGIKQSALAQRTGLVAQKQSELAAEVLKGTKTTRAAAFELQEYKNSLPTVELEQATKQGMNFQSAMGKIAVAIGVAGGLMATAKKAWDLGAEGASLQRVRKTFDDLSVSIGSTADAMLTKLRSATQGMVSDTELIMSTNRFLSMGLADTEDRAAELARIAVTLGAAMGKGAGPAMEEFALLLANQSIPRLDTFGISAARVRERIGELQAETQGLSREEAFLQAVMEQAAISMERLGNAVPTDPYTQFEVKVDNLKDKLKILISEALLPTADALNVVADAATGAMGEAVEAEAQALDEASGSLEEHEEALVKALEGYRKSRTFFGMFTGTTDEAREAVIQQTRAIAEGSVTYDEFRGRVESMGLSMELLGWMLRRAGVRQDENTEAFFEGQKVLQTYEENVQELVRAQGIWEIQQGRVTNALDETEMSAEELAEAIARNRQEIADFIDILKDDNLVFFNEELAALGPTMILSGDATGNLTALLQEAQEEYDEIGRKIFDVTAAPELFGLTTAEAAESVKEMTERQKELETAMARIQSQMGEATFATAEATVNYDALNTTLADSVAAYAAENAELGFNRAAVISARGALLGWNDEQLEAAMRSALISDAIGVLTRKIVEEGLAAEDAQAALALVAEGSATTAEEALGLAGRLDAVNQILSSLAGTDAEITVGADVADAESKLASLRGQLLGQQHMLPAEERGIGFGPEIATLEAAYTLMVGGDISEVEAALGEAGMSVQDFLDDETIKEIFGDEAELLLAVDDSERAVDAFVDAEHEAVIEADIQPALDSIFQLDHEVATIINQPRTMVIDVAYNVPSPPNPDATHNRQFGGTILPDMPTLVGEAGYEMITLDRPGFVWSNSRVDALLSSLQSQRPAGGGGPVIQFLGPVYGEDAIMAKIDGAMREKARRADSLSRR